MHNIRQSQVEVSLISARYEAVRVLTTRVPIEAAQLSLPGRFTELRLEEAKTTGERR